MHEAELIIADQPAPGAAFAVREFLPRGIRHVMIVPADLVLVESGGANDG
jgi:hypothetical protein